MDKVTMAEDSRPGRVRALELAVCAALGLVAFELTTLYPSSTEPATGSASSRENNWLLWFNAQQLYRRDPEELTESQLENVKQWCRCARLVNQYLDKGPKSLTDDECTFVADTLEKLCPNLDEHAVFLAVHKACCQRLADKEGFPLVDDRAIGTRGRGTRL